VLGSFPASSAGFSLLYSEGGLDTCEGTGKLNRYQEMDCFGYTAEGKM